MLNLIKSCRSFSAYASAIQTSLHCFQLKRPIQHPHIVISKEIPDQVRNDVVR